MKRGRSSWILLALAAAVTVAAGAELRDPMRPSGARAAATAPRATVSTALKLEGVIQGDTRVAIVNGRVVRAGDSIAGSQVLEILAQGIRVERAGKIQTLTLPLPANNLVRVAPSPATASSKE